MSSRLRQLVNFVVAYSKYRRCMVLTAYLDLYCKSNDMLQSYSTLHRPINKLVNIAVNVVVDCITLHCRFSQ